MKKSHLITTPKNIGLILSRINKFGQRVEKRGKGFSIKNLWGRPKKTEDWERTIPVNHESLIGTFKAKIHPNWNIYSKLELDIALIGLNFTERSALRKVFSSKDDRFETPESVFFVCINTGNKVIFKDNGVIIFTDDKDPFSEEKLSVFITF